MIITRFAPSPTGDPHIGNIRTALFNYLFAKHADGKFLLRIEDTDQNRHNPESIKTIKEALLWLDIVPENLENPVIQSERLEKYKTAATELIEQGHAYVCNCSKERLEQVRGKQQSQKQIPRYDNHCRELNLPYEEGCVVRMKIPQNKKITFDDLIRGEISVDSSTLDDQVLLKSDGFPTYHLAHAVDDHEMQTTHVFRGEEWLPSTPKHILLFEMLGFKPPIYAHLPVILSPTKGKLSKRDGATTILSYRKMGYLPEALINFMALLGWNPKTDEEFFTLGNLVKRFESGNINKSPAVFDIKKLDSFSNHYLQQMSIDQIRKISADFGKNELSDAQAHLITRGGHPTILAALGQIDELEKTPRIDRELLIFKKSDETKTKRGLTLALDNLESLQDWNEKEIQSALEKSVSNAGLSNGDIFWPIRYSLCGLEKSPSPAEISAAIGKEKSLSRIKNAISLL